MTALGNERVELRPIVGDAVGNSAVDDHRAAVADLRDGAQSQRPRGEIERAHCESL